MATYQPTEAEWNEYGTVFATSRFGSRIVRAALWGIQAWMATNGVSSYFKIPKERRKGHLSFLAFSGVLLAASSVHLVLDIWGVFNNLVKAGPNGRSYIEAFHKDAESSSVNRRVAIVVGSMGDLTVVVGDMLLLWRCLIMWRSRRWVIVLPFLACAGSIASRLVDLIVVRMRKSLLEVDIAGLTMTAECLSVSMNVMVTGLILFKLWRAWSAISKACPEFKRSRMYSNVAATLIESAAPLAISGICYVVVLGVNYYQKPEVLSQRGRINALAEVSAALFYSFSALSPQMIIFRVLNGQSWKNARESNAFAEKVSTTFRFETPRSQTSTNNV
ncbi:hypothetical protein BKA70DRAFT_1267212 [Coprinopsis sp. MPI-PUGE-AT-0042]|nr:hypothetical protein BKA70DRAFT_1267212 [Coprinopsis sp. MPI-PUGE-AT-0042]